MSDSSLSSVLLADWLERTRAGDQAARDELVRAVWGRMEQLTRKMLRQFPNVRRWEETGDVMQQALVRLLRTLEAISPEDKRAFYGLIATHIRRELLDLVRKYGSRERHGVLAPGPTPEQNHERLAAAADGRGEPTDLDLWARFHEAVEQLPVEQREVMGLLFYHGWTQAEVATLLQVSERTVRRYWAEACLSLHAALGGQVPPLGS